MILAAEERRTHSEAELDTWHIGLRKDISSCEVWADEMSELLVVSILKQGFPQSAKLH